MMMKAHILAAAAALISTPALAQDPAPATLASAAPAAAAEAPADPRFVEYPVWLPKDPARGLLFPEKAMAQKVSGSATAVCTVKANGRLEKCTIETEEPKYFGFGDALITVTRLMKMKPTDEDGAQTAGKLVRVPMEFKLPE